MMRNSYLSLFTDPGAATDMRGDFVKILADLDLCAPSRDWLSGVLLFVDPDDLFFIGIDAAVGIAVVGSIRLLLSVQTRIGPLSKDSCSLQSDNYYVNSTNHLLKVMDPSFGFTIFIQHHQIRYLRLFHIGVIFT